MKYIAFLVFGIVLCVPFLTYAETVLRVGENIAVETDQTVAGDYYVSVGPFSNTIMSGTVAEDMYAFGGSVTVNGKIGKDLTIVSGSSQIHGEVADDVRIVGGEVTIAEHIGGDLFVIGGVLKMLSTAKVDGDIIFFGGSAEINGTVGGSILGTSEKIRIDGEVKKDVNVKTATQLTLGDKAVVGGNLTYTSLDTLVRAQNATVTGDVQQNKYTIDTPSTQDGLRGMLIPLFITLFASLSLFLLFKAELQKVAYQIHASTLKSMLFGLGVLILGPIVALLLMVTVLGVLVGVISALLVLLAYVIGYALTGIMVGTYLSKAYTKHAVVSLPWILAGSALTQALLYIPGVGPIIVFFILAITVGGISISLYKLLS